VEPNPFELFLHITGVIGMFIGMERWYLARSHFVEPLGSRTCGQLPMA